MQDPTTRCHVNPHGRDGPSRSPHTLLRHSRCRKKRGPKISNGARISKCSSSWLRLCRSVGQSRTHLLGTHPIGLLPHHPDLGGHIQPTGGHPVKELLWRSQSPNHASDGAMINLDIHSPGAWIWPTMSQEAESCQVSTTENQGLMERKISPKELFCCSKTNISLGWRYSGGKNSIPRTCHNFGRF